MKKGRRGPEFFYTGMCANEQKVLYVRIELYCAVQFSGKNIFSCSVWQGHFFLCVSLAFFPDAYNTCFPVSYSLFLFLPSLGLTRKQSKAP